MGLFHMEKKAISSYIATKISSDLQGSFHNQVQIFFLPINLRWNHKVCYKTSNEPHTTIKTYSDFKKIKIKIKINYKEAHLSPSLNDIDINKVSHEFRYEYFLEKN